MNEMRRENKVMNLIKRENICKTIVNKYNVVKTKGENTTCYFVQRFFIQI